MSADIAVFHGSEIDDPSLLPGTTDGWYIGAFQPGETAVETDSIRGPYSSNREAVKAMVASAWLSL